MRRTIIFTFFLVALASAQVLPPGSAALTDNPFALYYNPAGLGFHHGVETYYGFPFDADYKYTKEFSLYTNMGGLGFSYDWIKPDSVFHQQYQLGLGFPVSSGLFGGFVYRWTGTVKTTPAWDIGLLYRPLRQLSLGINFKNIALANDENTLIFSGLGVRPFGDRLTTGIDFYGEYDGKKFRNSKIGGEIVLEPVRGLLLTGRYLPEDEVLQVSLDLFLEKAGYTVSRTSIKNDVSGAGIFFSASSYKHRTVFEPPVRKIVQLDFDFSVLDEPSLFSLKKFPPTVYQFVTELERMKEDKSVQGIYINFRNISNAGMAKLEEIRNALLEFRSSGKKIVAYADNFNNGTYYLASACDEIHLNPSGSLWLTGLASVQMFFKKAFDKIGVGAQFVRVGDFKSAVEPFIYEEMSDSNRLMINSILDDMNKHFVAAISSGRDLNEDKVQQLIDSGPYTAPEAQKEGLIDSLFYQDQMNEHLGNIFGKKTKRVKWQKYNNVPDYEVSWNKAREAKIAIIYATGSIIPGKSRRNPFSGQTQSMGSTTIASAIKKAREDKSVEAIVFRINSPGGSALASDIILREVELTISGENKKPFIVSMSDVAGSGGYWIASLADTIVADPSTITGSIGVLGGKINFNGTLDKLGINVQAISRGKNSLILSPYQPFSEEELNKIREQIEWIYEKFLENVSRGRGLTKEEVNRIGRGRIWTGAQGKENGLVDELGGITEALAIAKEAAGIDKEQEVNIEFLPGIFDMIFQFELGTMLRGNKITEEITDNPSVRTLLNYWLCNTGEYIHLMMPYSLEIE